MYKTNDFNSSLAHILHCNPMVIPIEYKAKTKALTATFVSAYSKTCFNQIDQRLVYDRACNCVNKLIECEPDFSPATYNKFLNIGTLFYSQSDTDLLLEFYRTMPKEETFQYVLMFFAVKLNNTKKTYREYLQNVNSEDVNSILITTLIDTLNNYNPEKMHFSFNYLEQQLRCALMEYVATSGYFMFNRNLYPQYRHMCLIYNKYNLSINEIERFLYEVQLSDEAALKENLMFDIDPDDKKYSFKGITPSKAENFYHIYVAESNGISELIHFDEEKELNIDLTIGLPDDNFDNVILKEYINKTFPTDSQKLVVYHFIRTGSSRFSAEELALYGTTRYEVKKVIEKLRDDLMK